MTDLTDTLAAAIRDFAERGFDTQQRLEEWVGRIRRAAEEELIPQRDVDEQLRSTLTDIYAGLVDRGGLMRTNPGIDRHTIDRVKPRLRAELNRRILASADLIRLNRDQAVQDTLRRFAGWATSVPPGGSRVVRPRQVRMETAKELADLNFKIRRVSIDQGHKFQANLSQILAEEGGAIAMKWHQHYTKSPRKDHTERDGKVFLIRDSWAHQRGLVRPGKAGYLDQVTQPAEEVNCRCTGTYVTAVGRLPDDMLTKKGREALAEVRRKMAA